MNKKLDAKLCSDFPVLYQERNLPMTETCMCWGFDVGDGWYPLVYQLSKFITSQVENEKSRAKYDKKPQEDIEKISVVAEQVKEKYGTLRYYWRGVGLSRATEERIEGAVSFAEWMSAYICEDCGNPGETRGGGWLRTLCNRHAKGRPPLPPVDESTAPTKKEAV